jgi:hypothetical protein
MTLTDEIYRELMDGLRTGVDYDKLRLKWEGSRRYHRRHNRIHRGT